MKLNDVPALLLVVGLVGGGIWFIVDKANSPPEPTRNDYFANCVSKGVRFYKEAGSYPKFTTDPNKGRLTEDIVRERCQKYTGAFDAMK